MPFSFEEDPSRKQLADEYANILFDGKNDDNRIDELRKLLGFNGSTELRNAALPEDESHNCFGIWKLYSSADEKILIRDPKFSDEFRYWSDIQMIPPKTDKTRIVLLGESAARGFLYEPYFTPAIHLEKILNANNDKSDYEVIDMSRVSIRIEKLNELCKKISLLYPDFLLVFAGNNFRKSLIPFSETEIKEYEKILHDADTMKVREFLEKKLDLLIKEHISVIYQASVQNNFTVIYIIPETNLKEWKYIYNSNFLVFMQEEQDEWVKLKKSAVNCIEKKLYTQAEELLNVLISKSRTSPAGYEVMAEMHEKLGNYDKAMYYYEKLRDLCLFTINPPPLITTFIRRKLQEYAEENHIATVDVSMVLRRGISNAIPGNESFIDYCHLTDTGICSITEEIAKKILTFKNMLLNNNLKQSNSGINNEVISNAHFFSAIHCAHNGQPYDILHYHLMKSLEYSKKSIERIKNYIDIATRKVPWEINKSYFELFSNQYSIINQMSDCKLLDITLVQAMEDALALTGIDVKEEIRQLRIKEHRPTDTKKVNMLETYYRASNYNNFISSNVWNEPHKAYVRFRQNVTKFYLIAENDRDIKLNLTYRTPFSQESNGEIFLRLNCVNLTAIQSSLKWKDTVITIEKHLLASGGVNIIELEWASLSSCCDEIKKYYSRFYKGFDWIMQASNPSYGEIMRFTAELAR